ncbi:putative ribonuclease H-like domain-containing protein [Tanacetum coccineum]
MDDLYNNLNVYETKVKGSSSSNQNSQNVAFVSSNNSGSSNQAYGSNSANTDSMSDVVIYSFFATQSNSPQLNDEDLKQIDADDLEEIDLKWQMVKLTMRAKRFLNKIGRKFNTNGSETIGYNKSKVECYNCHKKGHFARECRAPRGEHEQRTCTEECVSGETTRDKSFVLKRTWICLERFLALSVRSDQAERLGSYNFTLWHFHLMFFKFFKLQILRENERYKTNEEYRVVPPPYTGNFMPLKYDLILADEGEYVFSEAKSAVGNPQLELYEKGVINSGCSRHMTRNKSYLSDYKEIDGGFVAFGGDPKGGRITVNAVRTSKEHLFEEFSPFKNAFTLPDVPNVFSIDDTRIFGNDYNDEDVGATADLNNLETTMNKVWTLVDLPNGKRDIGTKWVFRNKKDERGIVIRNKARLVAQGNTQEEGIDYDEVFAPVTRIEAIRLFLAYASYMGFIVYQMDVKSAFLYGTIEEEVEKALYGLHQAPRAWYETLSTYLIENGFRRGTIDKTLFIKKDKGDILLVQVYVDDIIFGSTKKSLCDEFEGLMHKRFQMSSMGELTFFLGLQVQQKKDGIFISQDKYVADILKKFDFATVKTASTPMEPNKALIKDEEADSVDVHLYRSMIGSLMYLTASRPDIMFAVCACARFQVTPKMSHLHAVKRIFRYLKGQPKLGLWYPRDSPFDLEAFSDSDYAGASLDRKSTTGGCQFLGKRLISWQCKKQTIVANSTTEEYVLLSNVVESISLYNQAHRDKDHFYQRCYKKKLIQRDKEFSQTTMVASSHMALMLAEENAEFHQIVDFLSTCSINYALTVSPTIYASYIEQFWNTTTSKIVNSVKQIHVIVDGKAVVISESSVEVIFSLMMRMGMDTGGNPRHQDTTLRGIDAQTRPETASKMSRDPPLSKLNQTSGSGEGSMEHTFDLMDTVPPIPMIHLSQEEAKTTQDRGITRLKLRVKRLEKKRKARTPQPMKRRLLKAKGRNDKTKSMFQDSDFDVLDDDMEDVEGETVHTATTGVSAVSAPVTTAGVAISTAEPRTPPTTAATAFIDEDLTLLRLDKVKEEKDKVKELLIIDIGDYLDTIISITTLQPLLTIDPKDKGKGVLVKEEPEKPKKVKRRCRSQLNRSLTP